MKKEITIAELIKCLCIRFLDELFFEENIKTIKDEESKKKEKNDEKDSKNGSSGNLKNSFNSCKITPLKSNSKLKRNKAKNDSNVGSIHSNDVSNPFQGSFIANYTNKINTIEQILTSKMDFYGTIQLSQYTFKSFCLMLFREDLSNDKKIKIIKNDKYMKELVINDKFFQKTRYTLKVILQLFEKNISEGCDTAFMTKIQLIENNYNIFIELLKNTLENYLKVDDEKKKKIKPMINSIFTDKANIANLYGFYKIIIDNIITNYNFTGSSQNNLNYDNIKGYIDNELLIKVQNDITEFINNTIFEIKDPFFFKLIPEIYFQNDKNNEFIINVIPMILEKTSRKTVRPRRFIWAHH